MNRRPLPRQIEKRLLAPAVAHFLNARGFDWYHEVTISGRFRVDFIATGKHVTWLIDCKTELEPTKDIAQMKLYHDLFADPNARMMLATPPHYKPSSFYEPYARANIVVLKLEGDFSDEALEASYENGYERILETFPERYGLAYHLTREQIAEIIAANRRETTLKALAYKYQVPIATISWIYRMVGRKSWSREPKHTPHASTQERSAR